MVHVAVNKYDLEKINILESYAFGEGGGGHQKAYAVYAFINVDNCERPLTHPPFELINISFEASILRTAKLFLANEDQHIVIPQTKNTQTVIAHTNLGNKYGGSWTLAILAVHGMTFDLTQ